MATLLERIQQTAGTPQPEQRGIEKILRERGGRAVQARGPAASRLGEQAALTAGRQALREQTFAERLGEVQARGREQALVEQQALAERRLGQEEELAQERLAAEAAAARAGVTAAEEEARLRRIAKGEATTADINAQAEQRLRDLASARNIQMDDLFAQFEASNLELADRKDAAQLEQMAFNLAMQDKKYLDELDKIGQQRTLENDLSYDEELQRISMEANLDQLMDDIGFQSSRKVADRDYQRQLAQIDIDTAIEIARASARDAATRAKWQAAGQLGAIGAQQLVTEEEGK